MVYLCTRSFYVNQNCRNTSGASTVPPPRNSHPKLGLKVKVCTSFGRIITKTKEEIQRVVAIQMCLSILDTGITYSSVVNSLHFVYEYEVHA